ncbi:MAG: hypothetical protein LCH30_09320 [Proteobacteria bacterium]|nr:hypothetical protein [Pseudomonadota bacterium]
MHQLVHDFDSEENNQDTNIDHLLSVLYESLKSEDKIFLPKLSYHDKIILCHHLLKSLKKEESLSPLLLTPEQKIKLCLDLLTFIVPKLMKKQNSLRKEAQVEYSAIVIKLATELAQYLPEIEATHEEKSELILPEEQQDPSKNPYLNPNFHYLTEASCKKILEFYPLFDNGIDFEHLPAGFIVKKNPHADILDVLDFSPRYEKYHRVSPLAISLTTKTNFELENTYAGEQGEWYDFFLHKASGFCNKQELKRAFVDFSKIIKRLNLKFYKPDFSALSAPCNPVILLGRMATIMSNPNLRIEDRQTQWQRLLELPLIESHKAIRAHNDFENRLNPCTIVLPQMGFEIYPYNKITDRFYSLSFDPWRKIAFEKARLSASFYEQAYALLNENIIRGLEDNDPTIQLFFDKIVELTIKEKHLCSTQAFEKIQLDCLKNFFKYCENNKLFIFNMLEDAQQKGGHIAVAFTLLREKENPRYDDIPNLALFLEFFKQEILIISNVSKAAPRLIGSLIDSSNFESLENKYGYDIYFSTAFYFRNNTQSIEKMLGLFFKLDAQLTTEKQGSIFGVVSLTKSPPHPLVKALFPLIFSFELFEESDIENVFLELSEFQNTDLLIQALAFFKNLERPLPKESLLELIHLIKSLPNDCSKENLIDNLEPCFADGFAKDYFKEQREIIELAKQGQNKEIEEYIRIYRFSKKDAISILELSMNLFRQNNLEIECFHSLFTKLGALKLLVPASEFSSFVKHLDELSPSDIDELEILIVQLIKARSTNAFNQFAICNKKVNAKEKLIAKAIYFIDNIKPLTKNLRRFPTDKIYLEEGLATLILNLDETLFNKTESLDKLEQLTQDWLRQFESILEKHALAKQHMLFTFSNLPGKENPEYLHNLTRFMEVFSDLAHFLSDKAEQKLIFFSLIAEFKKNPLQLADLYEQIRDLEPENKEFVLKLISQFVSQSKKSKIDMQDMSTLINKLKQDADYFAKFRVFCKTPPYPPIAMVIEWPSELFAENYKQFSLEPFGPRRLDYAFVKADFERQKANFEFMTADEGALFKDANLCNSIDEQLQGYQNLSVLDLQTKLKELKQEKVEGLELLLLSVEMLSRTASQIEAGTQRVISQELNATQIMALWAMIQNPHSKVLSEIDTGEGKSRITMVMAAYQALLGKTVDILTSDLALAERDFLSYNPFFQSLGIPTSFIDIYTPKDLYQPGGVNFSDNSQLLLLRNQSDIALSPNSYLDKNKKNRVLLIDEADKFIHTIDSYNFAIKSKTLGKFVWIYSYLIDFIDEKGLDIEINEQSIDNFIEYVFNNNNDPLQLESLSELIEVNRSQFSIWLHSAKKAWSMAVNSDYKLSSANENERIPMRDTQGYVHYSRQILVLDNGRPAIGSSFANGAHQCLCAIENKRLEKEEFLVQAENEILRASFTTAFIDQYAEGRVYGLSGTTRAAAPKNNEDINHSNYQFIKVPRHYELKRDDQVIWHAKDEIQQFQFIKQALLKSIKANQPTLLICKDDKQSARFYEQFSNNPELAAALVEANKSTICRIEALSSKKEQSNAIDNAGQKSNITISTVGMFGRGVDIDAENLSVIAAYVPTFEDEKQIQGRTARAGKLGIYRLMPNLSDEDCPITKATHNIKARVIEIQNQKAFSASLQEEIANIYSYFLESVTHKFLEHLSEQKDSNAINKTRESWSKYLDSMQKDWSKKRIAFLNLFETSTEDEFKKLFEDFAKHWSDRLNSEFNLNFSYENKRIEVNYKALQAYQGFFSKSIECPTIKKTKYEPADDGQARIYDSVWEPMLATIRGERPLFADFRAWIDGRGEIFPDWLAEDRPIFYHLRQWINEVFDKLLKIVGLYEEKPVLTQIPQTAITAGC